MEQTVAIEANVFRAVAVCASDEETRYYLKGVALQVVGREGRIVATDGHRLMVHSFEANCGNIDIIIPSESIKRAFTRWPKGETLVLIRGSGRDWKIGDVSFAPIDGTFPDWTRVMPSAEMKGLGQLAHFNHNYVGDFGKIGKLLGQQPIINHFGDSPALITFGDRDDILGLLMPMRNHHPRNSVDLRVVVDGLKKVVDRSAAA